jgi:type II secretory pathway component GspD/PulD (secretin)
MKKSIKWSRLLHQTMKISAVQMALWLLCSGISLAHDGRAQDLLNKSVTIRVEDTGLRHVLAELEKQADIRFVYSSKAIKADRKISVNAKEQRLSDVLQKMLSPLLINYRIVEGQIILNPIAKQSSETTKEASSI